MGFLNHQQYQSGNHPDVWQASDSEDSQAHPRLFLPNPHKNFASKVLVSMGGGPVILIGKVTRSDTHHG